MAPLDNVMSRRQVDSEIEEVDGVIYEVWYVESEVDICTVGETAEQRIKFLTDFLSKLDAKHVGEATVTKLYQAGFQTLSALFKLKLEDLVTLSGFQKRSAERVVNAIQGALRNVPLARVAGASGVFGLGFGEKKIASVLARIPHLLEMNVPFTELCELLHTAGLQTTAPQFAERLSAFKQWLAQHPEITLTPVQQPASPVEKSLLNHTIVFSGFRNQELEARIVVKGGKVASAMSGKTTILVLKQLGTGKGKEQKAVEMGIEVLDADTFRSKYL